MQLYYLLSLLCLTFCAVAKCAITTGLSDCRAETKTEISTAEKTTDVYYCPDGSPVNYDKQSAKHHCCTVPLRRGKCPGQCRKLRSKRSMGGFFGVGSEPPPYRPTIPGVPLPFDLPWHLLEQSREKSP